MKKGISFVLAAIMALFLSACNASSGSSVGGNEPADQTESIAASGTELEAPTDDVKSDGYEKFSLLEIGMNESEVSAILGEPVRVDKAYYFYDIIVNGKSMEMTVWINMESGLVTYFSGDFDGNEYRGEFSDEATDLSKADDLENGGISSYEDCVSTFKTPGYLISLDEDGERRYLWVDANDGYMTVTFKEDGSVKTYRGFC